MNSTNVQIAVRVRPCTEQPLWKVEKNCIVQLDNDKNFLGETYSFDHIFEAGSSNKDLYDVLVQPLVLSCLEGMNCTIFAYGQTSSGKTYTMLGDRGVPGILNYTVEDVFRHIEMDKTKKYLLRCSFMEIYNEKINDLLDKEATDLKIREDHNGVSVKVKQEVISEREDFFALMRKGMKTRKIGCTDMNIRSSRSHTIFNLIIQTQSMDSKNSYTESVLSLVDLAGSERVGQMKMGRDRQIEGVSINKSLTTLGLVIRKLSENESFINYRDSKLTRLLQQSLGGNSKTLIIATITIAAAEETKSTLEFAQRAKEVKNRAVINKKVNDKEHLKRAETECAEYKEQLKKVFGEKEEMERTINALQQKIHHIEAFALPKTEDQSQSNYPSRRHTLAPGFYPQPRKGILKMLTWEEDNEDRISLSSLTRPTDGLTLTLPTLDEDNEESSNETNTPLTPRTIANKLRIEKQLLDESFEALKEYTTLERIFFLSDFKEDLCEVGETLRKLEIILSGNERGSNASESLGAIMKEELELYSSDCESSLAVESIEDRLSIEELQTKKLALESTLAKLQMENDTLRADLISKEEKILRDREVKKAEQEIMCEKIENMTKYKEVMHEKLSRLENRLLDDPSKETVYRLQEQNRVLTQKLSTTEEELREKSDVYASLLSSYSKQYDQIINLEEENNVLKAKLDENSIPCNYDYALKQTEIENEALSLELKEKEAESLRASDKNLTLKKLVKDLENDRDALVAERNKEAEALEVEINILCEDNKRLKSELQDVQFELSGEREEVERLCNQLDDHLNTIESQKSSISSLKKHNNALAESVAKLQHELDYREEQITALKEEKSLRLRDLEEARDTLQERYEENIKNLEDLRIKLKTSETKLKNLEVQLASRDAQIESLSENVCACREENELLRTSHNENLKSLEALRLDIQGKEAQITVVKEDNSLRLRDLENARDTLQEKYEENFRNLEDLRIKFETNEPKLKNLEVQMASKDAQIESLSEKVCACSEENELLRNKNKENLKSLEALRLDIQSKEAQITALREENPLRLGDLESPRDTLQERYEDNIKILEDLRVKFETSETKLKNLEVQLGSKDAQLESLSENVCACREENELLRTNYKENLKKLEALHLDIQSKEAQITALKEESSLRLGELESPRDTLQKRYEENIKILEDLRIKFETNETKLKNLEVQLASKDAQIESLSENACACREENELLRTNYKENLKKLEALRLDIQSKEAQIETLNLEVSKTYCEKPLAEEMLKLQRNYEEIMKSNQSLTEELTRAKERDDEQTITIEKLNGFIERLNNVIRTYQNTLKSQRLEIDAMIANREGQLSTEMNQQQREEAAAEVNRLTNELSELKRHFDTVLELPRTIDLPHHDPGTEDDSISVSDEMKSIHLKVQIFKDYFKEKTAQIESLKRDREDLLSKVSQLEVALAESQKDMSNDCRQRRVLEEQVSILTKQLAETSNSEPLSRENDDLKRKLRLVTALKEQSETKYNILKRDIGDWLKEKKQLESKVSNLSQQLLSLKNLHKATCIEKSELEQENSKLQQRIEECGIQRNVVNMASKQQNPFKDILRSSSINGNVEESLPGNNGVRTNCHDRPRTPLTSERPRSMSPQEVWKMRRQSLLDHRRGLSPEVISPSIGLEEKRSLLGPVEPVKEKPQMADKEVQVSTEQTAYKELLEKYHQAYKLAVLRKEEGNALRKRLNLPLNCPVLDKHL